MSNLLNVMPVTGWALLGLLTAIAAGLLWQETKIRRFRRRHSTEWQAQENKRAWAELAPLPAMDTRSDLGIEAYVTVPALSRSGGLE